MNDTLGRCHWVRGDDGLETLIPHCWGSINSPSFCTCDTKGSEVERALYGRMTAEQEVMRLRGKLERKA